MLPILQLPPDQLIAAFNDSSTSPLVRRVLSLSALLPARPFPWSWVMLMGMLEGDELAEKSHLQDYVREQFVDSPTTIEFFELDPIVRPVILGTISTEEAKDLRATIRDFIGSKLTYISNKQEELFKVIRRGHAGPDAADWYVAPLAEVQAKAAELGMVDVIPIDAQSFELKLKPPLLWEQECVRLVLAQEFDSDQTDGMMWALHTEQIPSESIINARHRIDAIYAANPTDYHTSKLYGIYLMNLSLALLRAYGSRSGFDAAEEALEHLRKLSANYPSDTTLQPYIDRAAHVRWIADW